MLKKLAKSGMFGLAGLAATNPDITNRIARNGGFGVLGLMAAKKKRAQEKAGGMRPRPMMDEVMMAEQVPASRAAPIMAGDVDAMMGRSAQDDMSGMKKGGGVKKMAKGGKLTDLTGDGKVTRADVLKGRGVPGFKKGSKVSAAEAVHKHERAKHKGQPLTKMAKGGSVSKRADGCATKGKTKGRFV